MVGTGVIEAIGAGVGRALTASGVAAIGRLVGASAEVPAVWLDGVAQGIRDKTEARTEISRALAAEAAKVVPGDPAVLERAMHSMLAKEYRSQVNKEAVAKKAIESLQAVPASEDGAAPTEQFMTNFERYAGDATDEDLQTIFGRLLAGEIRSPQSIPVAALHFVSMLDQVSAQLIQRVLPICWKDVATLDAMQPKLKVHEITTLEQIGFWSAGKKLPFKIEEGSFLIKTPRKNEGFVIQGQPGRAINLQIALLSPAAIALVASSEISINYSWLFDAFKKTAEINFMAVGRPLYQGDQVRIPGPYSESFGAPRTLASFSAGDFSNE